MNAIKLLKNDHHAVDQLFKKYGSTIPIARKEEIAQKIIEEFAREVFGTTGGAKRRT